MELRQLRQFIAVAEHLHFGRAAQALSMAQPPLSRAIRGFEDELGVELFHRVNRKVALSEAGRALLPDARAVLAAAGRLPEKARNAASGEEGELALQFVSIVDYSFLPDLLRRHAQRFPAVRIGLKEATTDVQIADLRAGRADAGILLGPIGEGTGDGGSGSAGAVPLAYQRLATEVMVLALPAHHPQAGAGGPASLAAFAGDSYICSPRHVGPRLYDAIIASCGKAGFSPRIVQEAIQMQTIISLVSAGIGIALVPEPIMSLKRQGVVYRRLRGAKPALEIGIAFRRDDRSAVLRRFIALASQSQP
jgi:DNA-binding transcriptional LysR family regulator